MSGSKSSGSWRSALGQVRACSGVLMLGLVQGMAIGWSSPAVAKLRDGVGPFQPTLDETSWIVSLFDLSCGVGVMVGAAVFARVGRRRTLLVGPVSFSGWCLLTYFATAPGYLMAARALAGAGQGVSVFSFIYVGEVATPALRGALILAVTLLLPVGQLVSYVVGPLVSFWTHALVPLPCAVLSGLLMLFVMDETPFYLAMQGQHDQVITTLARLRGRRAGEEAGDAVRAEARAVRDAVERQQRDAATWRDTFRPAGAKRAALIVLVESGALAAVGVTTVLAFTQQIFEHAGAKVRADVSAAVLIAIKVAMVLVSMVLIERLGRRLQLSLGAITNSLAMLGLSGFFLARDVLGADVSSVQWLPLACLTLFISATGVGVNAVPQVLMSELLSQRAKGLVAPVAIVIVSVTSFGLNKAFLLVGNRYGFHLPFGLYAVTNLLVAIFTFLVVPETKGKTLAEVQELLRSSDKTRHRKPSWDPRIGEKLAKNSLELTYTFPGSKSVVANLEGVDD